MIDVPANIPSGRTSYLGIGLVADGYYGATRRVYFTQDAVTTYAAWTGGYYRIGMFSANQAMCRYHKTD